MQSRTVSLKQIIVDWCWKVNAKMCIKTGNSGQHSWANITPIDFWGFDSDLQLLTVQLSAAHIFSEYFTIEVYGKVIPMEERKLSESI